MTTRQLALRIMLLGAVLLIVSVLTFGLAPGLDLAASRPFAAPGGGFPLSEDPKAMLVRAFWLDLTTGIVIGCALLALAGLVWPALRARAHPRVMGFVVLAYALGPGLVANAIFKNNWGRPRPREITLFGGDWPFVPALDPGGPCLTNCSFVSGEGSAFAALAIALLLVVWPGASHRLRAVAVAAAAVWVLVGSGLRVAFGGHFLSDTLFAAAFMALLIPALWLVMVRDPR